MEERTEGRGKSERAKKEKEDPSNTFFTSLIWYWQTADTSTSPLKHGDKAGELASWPGSVKTALRLLKDTWRSGREHSSRAFWKVVHFFCRVRSCKTTVVLFTAEMEQAEQTGCSVERKVVGVLQAYTGTQSLFGAEPPFKVADPSPIWKMHIACVLM
ncbi:hypothetical protein EYF80_013413 [Liparis tanakae]|uniref:Uncharacterized protein n=1 Tax=Liparis tanakae TaxID=230148 RepID=A0A4Z2IG00_9TELE|nr:hypothetical protein EYF80_013413 [Liparis tanakae]